MGAMLSGIALAAWADDAPVYDVDSYPPQFDGQSDVGTAQPPATSEPQEQMQQPQAQSQALPPATSYVPAQVLTTEQRLKRLEQQMTNAQHSTAAAKTEALQTEVQTLRGQVEDLTHQLQQLQTQQKAMFSDLDRRLSKQPLVTAPVKSPPANAVDTDEDKVSDTPKGATKLKLPKVKQPAVSPSPDTASTAGSGQVSQPDSTEEQQIYQGAYDLIKAKKYADAVNKLQGMLEKYPSGQFAANAHYWLGELHGLLNNNDQSAAEFATVIKDFPESPKVADAQLKLGLIYAGQFKWPEAKAAFKKVMSRYPGTASARLAAEQLKALKLAGH